ncbi:hypothetical protein LEP1GSC041_3676 [Leptospira noguchii str. 2006001870]|nr:hypothetical protein LEP1GSC041_3676 [Leptospira noguchii str. 2006001870]
MFVGLILKKYIRETERNWKRKFQSKCGEKMEAELEEEIAREQEILTLCETILEEPDLSEEEMTEVLETILEYEFDELEEELGRVSGRYKGRKIYRKIEIVRTYLKGEANRLIEGFKETDADTLYFLMSNLRWRLDEFPDVSILLSALRYHVRNQEPIDDKKQRKEYIQSYRYTIYQTFGILIDISEALDDANLEVLEQDKDLEKLLVYWQFEILEQFSKIYETRRESPYYKKLGWFKRWALGGYVTRTRDALYMYSSKKAELEKSKSLNEKRGGNTKKRRRKR